MKSLRLVLSLTIFLIASVTGQVFGQTPPVTKDSLHTIAGELKIVEVKANYQFKLLLNDKLILKTNCDDESTRYYATPEPTIHTYYKALEGLGEFEEVVLLQMQMLGNACDGGDLIFLGLKKNGSFSLSNSIDFCGGRPPIITWGSDKVTVFIPGGPPNRGTSYIPSETWVYEKGRVTKQRVKRVRKSTTLDQ